MNEKVLEEMKLSLEIVRSIFATSEISSERVVIFSKIIHNQSLKMGIGWKELINQYEELSFQIYNRNFKSNELDFFKQVRKAVKSKAYEELS